MAEQKNELGEGIPMSSQDQEEFMLVVSEGKYRLENSSEFQSESWLWTQELDDEGIFIFSYLLHDYEQEILSLPRLEESVYTLGLLRHRMLPKRNRSGLSMLAEFQIIFTLYEKLKQEEMSWDECEEYVMEQVRMYQRAN